MDERKSTRRHTVAGDRLDGRVWPGRSEVALALVELSHVRVGEEGRVRPERRRVAGDYFLAARALRVRDRADRHLELGVRRAGPEEDGLREPARRDDLLRDRDDRAAEEYRRGGRRARRKGRRRVRAENILLQGEKELRVRWAGGWAGGSGYVLRRTCRAACLLLVVRKVERRVVADR